MPKITGKAKRVRIYLCQTDRSRRHTLYELLVAKAKELDMAGASVFRGIEGYGAHCRSHEAGRFSLSCDVPILVEIVDSEEYIARLLPVVDDLVEEGLVTIDDVDVIMYGALRPRNTFRVEAFY
jgi:PII-like signaling protein